jgi:DNA-binding transcriptional ArsR family regulator
VANWDFIIAPTEVKVEFKVSPAIILVHSLHLVSYYEDSDSGLHSWIAETARSLTPEQKHHHHMILGCISDTLVPIDNTSFPDFLAQLASLEPAKFQDEALSWMKGSASFPGKEAALADVEPFLAFIRHHFETKKDKHQFDEAMWREIHALFIDPPRLKQAVIEHLQFFWDTYLAKEWKRSQSMLHDSVAAFSKKDFSGLNAFEAVEAVTGRDMRGSDNMGEALEKARRLVFIPSPHLGPYISWQSSNNDQDCAVLFGARLPKGAEATSPALNRNELLVWLNALADDTRLKMLEMLFEHEELCAQDFIDMLELSQSSASRHLRQLTASGFLKVRRRDVNKCYTLNRERVEDTMTILGKFLHK